MEEKKGSRLSLLFQKRRNKDQSTNGTENIFINW